MYHYRECGLRNVWLANGYEDHATPYGSGVSIHDVEGLHREIARGLVAKVGKLTGAELRFLRQEMRLSQAKLAAILGNEAQTVALWEKRGQQPKMADRFIRAIYREQIEGNAHIIQMIERMIDRDLGETEPRLTLQQDGDKWRFAA
ncbi:MAG: transcriptional regulator [Phenylobacterium zucineum]|nr:MAG: transcriptional regulator [Phenylobacterium zucineum]